MKAEKWGTFTHNLAKNLKENFDCPEDMTDWTARDNEISQMIKLHTDTDRVIQKFTSAITLPAKKRRVPWWTKELTILRKKTLALRRRFQRTKNDDNPRLERRQQYQESNRIYQMRLREEKLQSWKDFCSNTNSESSNPWNGAYRYAAGRQRNNLILTTLNTGNNNYTTDMETTIIQMIEHFVPEYSEDREVAHHKQVRLQASAPLQTINDVEFTRHEVQAILEKFDHRKAPGEDALSSEILMHVFRTFPTVFTQIYKECLRRGHFPKQWKRSMILPIIKPGKEGHNEAGKYRQISLINIGGKILEKLLIERINHHLYSKRLLNENQYGFLPQKSKVDASMAVEGFAETHLQQRNVVIITSLDVQGAFDAAWWPAILYILRKLQCHSNLYNLTRSYFSDRVAILCANMYRKERKVTKGYPPRFLLRPRPVERSIQHPPRPGLLQPHKSNSLRRRPGGETTAEAEAFINSEL